MEFKYHCYWYVRKPSHDILIQGDDPSIYELLSKFTKMKAWCINNLQEEKDFIFGSSIIKMAYKELEYTVPQAIYFRQESDLLAFRIRFELISG